MDSLRAERVLSVKQKPQTAFDWNTAKVQEKVDGSIVKLWFDHRLGKWQFSTNGVIRAEKAPLESVRASNYLSLIQKAKNFADIPAKFFAFWIRER